MIGQTVAIFHDAYREMNAKRMFWIVLILSGVVVLAFASVGIRNEKLAFLWFESPIPMPMAAADFYKLLFASFGIKYWLAFAATVLALISTASIFPDLITGGSIDLYLSKPIGRLRLFLTKYFTGLLFVALQVTVFATASFLLIGIRGDAWEPGIFLSVPLVLCVFSYLFALSVMFGVVTRSTLAAVLLTVLVWGFVISLDFADQGLLLFVNVATRERASTERRIKYLGGRLAYMAGRTPEQQEQSKNITDSWQQERADLIASREGTSLRNLTIAHDLVYAAKTVLPKTRETAEVMNRVLLRPRFGGTGDGSDWADEDEPSPRRRRRQGVRPVDVEKAEMTMRNRPLRWIIGTSLAFEAVVLTVAAWVFCRRDY